MTYKSHIIVERLNVLGTLIAHYSGGFLKLFEMRGKGYDGKITIRFEK